MSAELKTQIKAEMGEKTFHLVGLFKYLFLIGGLFFLVVAVAPVALEALSTMKIMFSLILSAFALLSFSLSFWRYRLTHDFLYSESWIFRKRVRLSDINTVVMAGDLLLLRMHDGKQEKYIMIGQEFRALARILLDKYGGHTTEAQNRRADLLSAQKNSRLSQAIQVGFLVIVVAGLYYLNRS